LIQTEIWEFCHQGTP